MSGGVWRKCSSSPISTDKKNGLPAMLGAIFLICGDTRLQGRRVLFPNPLSHSATSPFQGECGLRLWLRPVAALLRLPCGSLADAPPRRLMPPSLRPQRTAPHLYPILCPIIWGDSGARTVCQHFPTVPR